MRRPVLSKTVREGFRLMADNSLHFVACLDNDISEMSRDTQRKITAALQWAEDMAAWAQHQALNPESQENTDGEAQA